MVDVTTPGGGGSPTSSPTGGSAYVPPVTGPVTPEEIYYLLIQAGASTNAAIGIMANMINESGLNPEAQNPGGPAAGVGLVQWETTSYPGAASLVTGNAQNDVRAQVNYLAQTGGFAAASGPTGAQAAANFAANYEKCASCQPGGAQYAGRVANAATVAGWVASGNWPTSAGSGTSGSGGSSGTTSAGADCAFGFSGVPDTSWISDIFSGGGNVGQACLLSYTDLRRGMAIMLFAGAGLIGFVSVAVLAVYGLGHTSVGGAVGKVAGGVADMTGAGLEFAGLGRVASAAASGSGKTGRRPGRAQPAGTPEEQDYEAAARSVRREQYRKQMRAASSSPSASASVPAYRGRHRAGRVTAS